MLRDFTVRTKYAVWRQDGVHTVKARFGDGSGRTLHYVLDIQDPAGAWSLFFFNDTATTEIYTLSYTTLFRSGPHLAAQCSICGTMLAGGLSVVYRTFG